jgi:MSHA pilin protein MshA
MSSNHHAPQRGFTLIELVVVIVILGILAAFAIPRFVNISTQARASAVQGLAGSLRSSAALAHGLALAQGRTAASGQTISMEGEDVDLAYGYPTATATGIGRTVANLDGFQTTFPSATTMEFTPTNQPANTATCRVLYTAATAGNLSATVQLFNSDCS